MAYKNQKIAFVFPGQGAQYVGMATDFIAENNDYKDVLNQFKTKSGFDLEDVITNGPEETLKDTKFTQPAILFHSIVAFLELQKRVNIKADYVAGHSLGEFSALVANGVLSLNDALFLVHKRGEFMIKANDGQEFAMSAVLGLAPDKVKEICDKASKTALVVAANFNTPVQTVISGTKEGVEIATTLAKEEKAKRVMPLLVGGPFHSPLIEKAGKWLEEEMKEIAFNKTDIPVVANINALPEIDPVKIKNNLIDQVTNSVQWVNTVNYLTSQGLNLYIEFGPQKVLSGMITKINPEAKVFNIDKIADIEKVINELEAL
ncbi:MAG TPA: ACP S-malonyltransferase [Candidatus Cloacimonadota bacterium]|jgi:[acyl-carrier-protein] S-malonyltransferase|nr:ACP S-malonyltransferase [Candidatus Cloacimonadales bacterium]HPY95985.1 ACP S-malonyltransferase [Candidatus Cloacimonadota bacterium]HQB40591.1 ACP S-malonyltransferase [Candidatus Cloacimonadota bacterium]